MRLNSSISSRGERFTILTLSISYSLISTPLLKFNMTASIASFIFTIFSLGFMACSLLVAKPSRDAAGRFPATLRYALEIPLALLGSRC
ncbi:hypothetical protein CRECT_1351 [Campylobacter rectus]|uniref:Uncharacterized protein n=1 Tax=Campylobacter rectus TaxID=203 RepID=A0A6G5QMR9_CAMRE|nr:hypothetical protein CRECT_1351 [Campylobacter rectus]